MKKLLDPKNLPYVGALVQAVLFALAGNKFFDSFGWLFGLGVGMVVNYSIALASSRISDIAQKRKGLAYLALAGLLCLSPLIICATLGFTLANLTWALACDLSIALSGFIAGKSLIPQSEIKPSQKVAERKGAKRIIRSAKIICRYAGAGCERTFATQNSANAHARACQYKPTISMPIEQKVTKS